MSAAEELRVLLERAQQHNSNNNNVRNQYEEYHKVVQSLRDTGDPSYLFLRTILEVTSTATANNATGISDEIVFQSILGFKHVVLHRYSTFSPHFTNTCKLFFLALGLNLLKSHTSSCSTNIILLAKPLANACLVLSASLFKRSYNTNYNDNNYNTNNDKQPSQEEMHLMSLMMNHTLIEIIPSQHVHDIPSLFPFLQHFLLQPFRFTDAASPTTNITSTLHWYQACNTATFLSSLLQEFSGSYSSSTSSSSSYSSSSTSSSSTTYNCSLSFHKSAHIYFESKPLLLLLDLVHNTISSFYAPLHHLTTTTTNIRNYIIYTPEFFKLFQNILSLWVDIYSWELDKYESLWFSSTSSSASGTSTTKSSTQHVVLRLPEQWRQYVINPQVLSFLFSYSNTVASIHAISSSISFTKNSSNTTYSSSNFKSTIQELKHLWRQLLILYCSLTGPIFETKQEKNIYGKHCLEAILSIANHSHTTTKTTNNNFNDNEDDQEESQKELLDLCIMIARLVHNYPLETISTSFTETDSTTDENNNNNYESQSSSLFQSFLSYISQLGISILNTSVQELQSVGGDLESISYEQEWRDDIWNIILECCVSLSDDSSFSLFHSLSSQQDDNHSNFNNNSKLLHKRNQIQHTRYLLAQAMAPLYQTYITCRIETAKMEEYYFLTNSVATDDHNRQDGDGGDVDEIREEISYNTMEEEMACASSLGRLYLDSSLAYLIGRIQNCYNQYRRLFVNATGTSTVGEVTAEAAIVLEELRILIVCICHLLTDDCSGETPLIPEDIVFHSSSSSGNDTTMSIQQIVSILLSLAEFQASQLVVHANNPHLSPLLAKTLLWFLIRWVPAYVLPQSCDAKIGISTAWNTLEKSQDTISFCVTLCLHYLCYWPQENQVLDNAISLLLCLSKRGSDMRTLLVNASAMEHLVTLHTLTSGLSHSSNTTHLIDTSVSAEMIRGYHRMPYKYRAKVLTVIIIANSESDNVKGTSMLSSSLQSIYNAFNALINALNSKSVDPNHVSTKEMACLCVELYGGIVRTSEMSDPERIVSFITPSLMHLSNLMSNYAEDLSICESLLILYKDYTEQFISLLNREQCLSVFRSSAILLKAYSMHHCSSRSIRKATSTSSTQVASEEEQSYNDISSAIQLLTNLGAKDFLEFFSASSSSSEGGVGGEDVTSGEVTEVIFFGLQQILPLMTQGLLHYPNLCKQYFSLVGFMMDTYPEKVSSLPFDLFRALLDSLLFGMSHTDLMVSRSSLQGIAGLVREHIDSQSLSIHLSQDPNIIDECSVRLLKEVIFQSIIWDRLEAAALTLLPLAAIDMNKFVNVVNGLSSQLGSEEKQKKMQLAFEQLMQPDVIAKVRIGNYGGRMNKLRFKRDFEVFVKDLHSAVLVI